MGIKRRLEALEAKVPKAEKPCEAPMRMQVHFKHVECYRARASGEDPPPYTQGEIEHMREDDLETVAGRGLSA